MTNPARDLTRAEESQAIALIPDLVERVGRLTALVERLATATTPQPAPALLTVREFAERAGLSECSIRRHISDGTLPSVRMGGAIRIPASALRPASVDDISTLARSARR